MLVNSEYDPNNLVSRKRQVLERNVHLNLYVIQFYVVIVRHFVKQSAKPLGFLMIFHEYFLSSLT